LALKKKISKFSAPSWLPEVEIMVGIEKKKKNSNFSAWQHLAEAENLVGSEEKKFQKFPPHHSCLRWKIWLALGKKISQFSAPPELPRVEILISLA
jgi:hypothetical protein